MKHSKSLFKIATEKYTSMSSDLKETKKLFLEAMASPVSAADLNKSYSNQQIKANNSQIPQPEFSNPQSSNTVSNPGGKEKPAPVANPAAPAPGQPQAAPPAPGGQPQTLDLTRKDLKITKLADGRILYEDPDPNSTIPPVVQAPNQMPGSIKESVKATIYTVEDIMSALSVLGGGSNSEALTAPDLSEEGDAKVNPAGDMLVDEEDDTNSDGMTDMSGDTSSGDSEVSENDNPDSVDQSGEMGTSGSDTNPSKIDGKTDSTWSGIGGKKAPEVEGEGDTKKKVIPDDKTGVDSSYTQEDGQEATEKGKDFTKGAGQAKPEINASAEPQLGEGEGCAEDGSCVEDESEMEANPSGKESAFWVPNDDMLGLKDIVGTVAKKNGVPNAQETIGKDAAGNLVKKPTTPKHSVPNMRQYVKTNGVPGAPSIIPPGGQPVDISDLDDVIGMDSTNDRALNISLNFNF